MKERGCFKDFQSSVIFFLLKYKSIVPTNGVKSGAMVSQDIRQMVQSDKQKRSVEESSPKSKRLIGRYEVMLMNTYKKIVVYV